MILYVEYPKESTKKHLELISEFGKIVGYKVSTQNSVIFLYATNELTKSEIKKITK